MMGEAISRRGFGQRLATGVSIVVAAGRANAGDTDAIRRCRELIPEIMQAKKIPGMSVAVARERKILWSEGFGLASLEHGIAVNALTRFRLGSVSKLITAAAVAKLHEDGRLDLDAPVQRYVPEFPQKQWPVTVRQIAGHLGGIRHYSDSDFAGPLKGAPHFDTVKQSLSIFANDPLKHEPGTAYLYSSYGWNLISAAVEGASGTDFLSYVQTVVLKPQGLRGITADQVSEIIPGRTDFYAVGKDGRLRNADYVDNSYKWAGGGFLSNAEDLAHFGSMHLQPGFLQQRTLDLLFTSQRLSGSGKATGVGIGWRIGKDNEGRRILHHGGTIDGGRSMIMMFPEAKLVVVLLANLLATFGEKEAIEIGQQFLMPA
jgi:serine beta-lactamase-like protein LACTB